jgi:hypothetical protein
LPSINIRTRFKEKKLGPILDEGIHTVSDQPNMGPHGHMVALP